MENERSSDRRRFVSKIARVAALGSLASLLLGQGLEKAGATGAKDQIAFYIAPNSLTGSGNLRWDDLHRNFIAGSSDNTVWGGVSSATISGGFGNKVTRPSGTVGGGANNSAGKFGTVGGGDANQADGVNATVGGGHANRALDEKSTVSGGESNFAQAAYATVGGGKSNSARSTHATVGGGETNVAQAYGATVGGGHANQADGVNATVGGGFGNVATGIATIVSGGYDNRAIMEHATVGGGRDNQAGGRYATVPGGDTNIAAGDYSFAAGRMAKVDASHTGAILFADSKMRDFCSLAQDEFAARATGGTRFVTAIDFAGSPTVSFHMTSAGELLPGKNDTGSVGKEGQKWNLVRATSITSGDIAYENGVRSTEDDDGIAFYNPQGRKIAKLDAEGNWHIKGKVVEEEDL